MKATPPHLAAAYIQQHLPQNFNARIGVILGSGSGGFVDNLENKKFIDYEDIPHFPKVSVPGHGGKLVLGNINGVAVICLQGRAHPYEGDVYTTIKTYVRCLKLLGCEYLIVTNASGSLREDFKPGELMLITDHINFQPGNPLVGPNDEEFGPRFFALDDAYDPKMRDQLLTMAHQDNICLHQGTYLAVLGPNYETAAEIRMFRQWGADAVAMSTVPEVLVANHCGMKVAAIAIISNFATGLSDVAHSHEAVVLTASQAMDQVGRLLSQFIAAI